MRKLISINHLIRMLAAIMLLSALPVIADELETINQRVLKPENMEASFNQKKYLKILTTPLVSAGHFWISRKNGVVWQVEKPFYSRVVITGDGVSLSDKQSQRIAKSMEYIGKILHSLLSGDLMKIKEQFTVLVKNTGKNNTDWEIELEPRSVLMRKGIEKISMSGNEFIKQLILHEATGDKTEITFSDTYAMNALPVEVLNAFGKH